ncbi:efflux RND transporter periplasmic adaptor subunit [Fodinisporobacter ferrooxydans]|uniref:Efflux RND transporter periplasmic adaptor subunit n=1 Tax=Fodinisporobacter ferrooxydans TaxID=2901836 RepID=A0ABY4CRX2_9BACL|nr:efflux RND transporter periplasmic adaptor subunit [Alicyclobacillaceae bacterium MYW30-H2]
MNRKLILSAILTVIVLLGAGIGGYFWYESTHFVSTDDARISGNEYRVMPQIPGQLTHIYVHEGQNVTQNEVIGEQDTSNLDPSMINKALLRAPITGTIVKWFSKENEMVSPGQPVALMMNMKKLYVESDIEETYIDKVKLGEPVDITVDMLGGETLHGRVMKIYKASDATFSLLPAINTSGNFNKVTQRVPIEISIDDLPAGQTVLPGTNVEVKIHIQ